MVIFDSKPEKGELNKVIDHLNLISSANHYGWLMKKSHFFSRNIIARHDNSLTCTDVFPTQKQFYTTRLQCIIQNIPKKGPYFTLFDYYASSKMYQTKGGPYFTLFDCYASSKMYQTRAALISHYLTIILHPKYTKKGPLFHRFTVFDYNTSSKIYPKGLYFSQYSTIILHPIYVLQRPLFHTI